MYTDSQQNFIYTCPLSCDNIPQSSLALKSDNGENCVLIPRLLLRLTPMLFQPKQVQSAKSPNTFTARKLEFIHLFPCLFKKFWNRVLLTEHSKTKPKILENPCCMTF